MLHCMKTDKFLMGFQLKLLGLCFFLVLTLSLVHGKNVTVKVVGVIHCTDCISHDSSSSQTTSDINISIYCKSKNQETKTQAKGSVNKDGNFNVTLSADITNDDKSIDSCFAKLQSTSPDPCPIQSAQAATVKLLSIEENATQAQNKPKVIKFSPVTCQSAFFWPFTNITFFPFLSPPPRQPPAEYSPPPSEALTPLSSPAPAPELPYSPPFSPPSNEPIPQPTPKRRSVAPPPQAFHRTPSVLPGPSLSPTTPPTEAFHRRPSVAPTPILPLTPPAPVSAHATPPELETPIPSPPNGRKPSPIPRAPPVPKLPPFPTVPRKYFNSPKSRSQPPRSSYPSHS